MASVAFSIALAAPCPWPTPPAKLEKMTAWTVRRTQPDSVLHAQHIGRHAAEYACRKRREMRTIKPRIDLPFEREGY